MRGENSRPALRPDYVRAPGRKLGHASFPLKNTRPAQESWGGVASWYVKHLESPDTYHAKVILPNLLRLISPKKGERILDIACGEGFFTRALSEAGAKAEGVDVGEELLSYAKQKTPDIPYHTGSAEDLSAFPKGKFDHVLIALAIQNIAHADKVIAGAHRLLKAKGAFHIVMNHPAFRIPRQSAWEWNEKGSLQSRRVDAYLSESSADIEMHPGRSDSPKTVSYHRPLQYYFKALTNADFVVDRLEEWISHRTSDSGPRAAAENKSRKEIPLFLYIRARKL